MFNTPRQGYTGMVESNNNTNTRCDNFYSDNGRLEVSLWNNYVSLRIAPSTGVDARGLRTYESDNNRIMSTCIKFENIESIIEAVENELIPAAKDGKDKTISFMTAGYREGSKKKLITIGYSAEIDTYYLSVAANLDEDGKGTPEQTIRFDFERKEIFVDYDLTTGDSLTTPVQSDFNRFMKIISGYTRAIPMEDHGVRFVKNRYRQSGFGGQQQFNQQRMGAVPQQQPMQQAGGYSAPVTQFEGSFDDLPF